MFLAIAQLVAESPPIAVTPDIHPMSSPAFTVARILQQSIDNLLVPIGRVIGFAGSEVRRRRGESDEIEVKAADQGSTRGFWLGRQPGLLPRGGDERIDWIAEPLGVLDGGRRGLHARPESPVIFGILFGCFIGGGVRSLVDPNAKELNLGG